MKRANISKIAFGLWCLASHGHALSTEVGSTYVGEGEIAAFSLISAPAIGPLTVGRIDLLLPGEELGGHYSLTSIALANTYFSIKNLVLELPGYKDPLETRPVSAGLSALELRYPLADGRISAGYFGTHNPSLSGKVDGVSAKLRSFDLSGLYANAEIGDVGIFGIAGSIKGIVAISKLEAGAFDGRFGIAGMKWKTYGIAGGYFRGDCSLADNILFNLFSGKVFAAEGNASLGAFGAWGCTEFTRGRIAFSVVSFLGLAWSFGTDLTYQERRWTIGDSDEFIWKGELVWEPAGLAVIYPKFTLNLDPSLSIGIARVMPVAWGWNFNESEKDVSDSSSEDSDWGAVPNLSLETLLFSGLTVSAKIRF